MATRMQQRRGTAAEWAALNPVLADGEIGVETNTGVLKVGNGVDPWSSLTSPFLLAVSDNPAQGDLFVAGVGGLTSRLPIGSDGQFLRADPAAPLGVRWGGGPGLTKYEWTVDSMVWTKTEGAKYLDIIVIGAGGGGPATALSAAQNACGGGGGGYGHWGVPAGSIPDTVNIAVGAAGQPGFFGTNNPTAGGASGFGNFVVSGGEAGGIGASVTARGGRPSGTTSYSPGSGTGEINPFAGGFATSGFAGNASMYGGGAGGGLTNNGSAVSAKAGGQGLAYENQDYGIGGKGGAAFATTAATDAFGVSGQIPGGGGGAAVAAAAAGKYIIAGGGAPGCVIVVTHF